MPENNHEVIIDGYVYPDTVTITLANDDFVGSRDYVSKDLYESADSANDYWQDENAKLREERDGWKKLCTDQEVVHAVREETLDKENAKLRELVQDMWLQLLNAYDRKEVDEFADRMRELSMEVVR